MYDHQPDFTTLRITTRPGNDQPDDPVTLYAACVCGNQDAWVVSIYPGQWRQTAGHLHATGTSVLKPATTWQLQRDGHLIEAHWDGPGCWVRMLQGGQWIAMAAETVPSGLAEAQDQVDAWAAREGAKAVSHQ